MNLQGKKALVTGGGSGIGLGIAQALSEAGCAITITGRTELKLAEAAADEGSNEGKKVSMKERKAMMARRYVTRNAARNRQ